MLYKITQCQDKTLDNYGAVKDISATDVTGALIQGSVWKKQKDGTDFPDFYKIVVGAEIELNAWTSPKSGKVSFFAPKPKSQRTGGNTAAIKEAQTVKREDIRNAQENKETSIKIASTFTAAWNTAIAIYNTDKNNLYSVEELFTTWRTFYWKNWDSDITKAPF